MEQRATNQLFDAWFKSWRDSQHCETLFTRTDLLIRRKAFAVLVQEFEKAPDQVTQVVLARHRTDPQSIAHQ